MGDLTLRALRSLHLHLLENAQMDAEQAGVEREVAKLEAAKAALERERALLRDEHERLREDEAALERVEQELRHQKAELDRQRQRLRLAGGQASTPSPFPQEEPSAPLPKGAQLTSTTPGGSVCEQEPLGPPSPRQARARTGRAETGGAGWEEIAEEDKLNSHGSTCQLRTGRKPLTNLQAELSAGSSLSLAHTNLPGEHSVPLNLEADSEDEAEGAERGSELQEDLGNGVEMPRRESSPLSSGGASPVACHGSPVSPLALSSELQCNVKILEAVPTEKSHYLSWASDSLTAKQHPASLPQDAKDCCQHGLGLPSAVLQSKSVTKIANEDICGFACGVSAAGTSSEAFQSVEAEGVAVVELKVPKGALVAGCVVLDTGDPLRHVLVQEGAVVALIRRAIRQHKAVLARCDRASQLYDSLLAQRDVVTAQYNKVLALKRQIIDEMKAFKAERDSIFLV